MLRLIDRKTILKKLLRRKHSRILYLDHVEGDGRLLFEQIVAMDLEGIVCKRKDSPYKVTERLSRPLDQLVTATPHSFRIAARLGHAVMPLCKIGDHVERIDALAPRWMKEGIMTKVIPNKHAIDAATQYEVDFGQ